MLTENGSETRYTAENSRITQRCSSSRDVFITREAGKVKIKKRRDIGKHRE